MIRELRQGDKADFLQMENEFYHSSAVLHTIPESHYERTFQQLMEKSPYVKAYVFEEDGQAAGYALLAFTYSNEAGGLTAWIEELYLRPMFQKRGLGSAFFAYVQEKYGKSVVRLRLELEESNRDAQRLYEKMGFHVLPYVQMYKDGIMK